MKHAIVKFIGRQEGFGTVPSFDLYNIIALSEKHPELAVNSTVTLATIRKAGFVARCINPGSAPLKVGAL